MLGEKLRPSSAPHTHSVSGLMSGWMSGWMSGSGAAVAAVCVFVAAVCACVALLLYRAVRGRPEGSTEDTAAVVEKNRAEESTEGSDDAGSEECETDSSEALILSSAEEDPRETTQEKLKEPTEDLTADFITDVRDTRGRECLEVYSGQVKRESVVCDSVESIKVEADLMDCQYKGSESVEKEMEDSHTEDVDEPSETESAQEVMEAKNLSVHKCQSVDDLLDSPLMTPDVISKPLDETVLISSSSGHLVEGTKLSTEDTVKNAFENRIDDRLPQVKESDCCCFDQQPDPLSRGLVLEKTDDAEEQVIKSQRLDFAFGSSVTSLENNRYESRDVKYDPVLIHPQQNYLGFTALSLPGDSTGQVKLKSCSVSAPVEVNCDKNEINIMEAIMDSNEWLSTGPPDTRDLPWLAQTQTSSSYAFKTNTSTVTASESNTVDIPWLSSASANASFGHMSESIRSQQGAEKFQVASDDTVISVTVDEDDFLSKKVAAVSPMPQMVQVSFRVHYVTHSSRQLLAVTGSQKELGSWEGFVPLQRVEDWFWANAVLLPTESQVEWKFVLVEDGKIRRWEECGNRHLVVSGQDEEIHLNKSWGYF